MTLPFFEQGIVALVTAFVFGDPALGKLAGLNVFERDPHAFFHAGINDLRANRHIAPLRRFGNGETHAADTGFIHQISDELHFMKTLEVGHLRRVTGFDQNFEPGRDERTQATTENRLLAEKIGFSFFLEGRLEDAGASATDGVCPGESDVFGFFAALMERNEAWDASAFDIFAPHDMTRAFGRNHDDIDSFRRNDRLEIDREAVSEQERLSVPKVGQDVFFIHCRLLGVGQRNKDHIRVADRVTSRDDLEAFFLGDRPGFTAGIEANDHIVS